MDPARVIDSFTIGGAIMKRFRHSGPLRHHGVVMGLMRRTVRENGEPLNWRAQLQGRKPPILYGGIGSAFCPLCGQESYSAGMWIESFGRRSRGGWHSVCVDAYRLWCAPQNEAREFALAQGLRCAESGAALVKVVEEESTDRYGLRAWSKRETFVTMEVDHRIPLWRVWREIAAGEHSWPNVLDFWGYPNLAAITPEAHKAKSKREAAERARMKRDAGRLLECLPSAS